MASSVNIRHYLSFPTTRSNPELLPPEVDPVLYHPKPRNAIITTFCRKLKALMLKRVRTGRAKGGAVCGWLTG